MIIKKCPHCELNNSQERIYLDAISQWVRADEYPDMTRGSNDIAHYRCKNCGLVSIVAWEEEKQ